MIWSVSFLCAKRRERLKLSLYNQTLCRALALAQLTQFFFLRFISNQELAVFNASELSSNKLLYPICESISLCNSVWSFMLAHKSQICKTSDFHHSRPIFTNQPLFGLYQKQYCWYVFKGCPLQEKFPSKALIINISLRLRISCMSLLLMPRITVENETELSPGLWS